MKARRPPLALLGFVLAVLLWSGMAPKDRFTWWLEVAPVLIALPVMIFTARRFPLTPLLYVAIAAHMTILMVGGHYTYADMPLFNWLRDEFGLARNHYDRVGHLAQGFVPALVAREILLRKTPLRPGAWLFVLVTCVGLAVSAAYELIEWGGGRGQRRRSGRISRHPGRSLGYAEGHGPGAPG